MELNKKIISERVDSCQPIEIQFFQNDNENNIIIKDSIDAVTQKYFKSELSDILYGCVKELVINATKANLKRVFFHKINLDIHNMGQYVQGLVKFKSMLERHEYKYYFDDLKTMNLWVRFSVIHNDDGIIFDVTNNSAISEVENGRIRMKLKKAMKYNDIVTFYNKEHFDGEGAGIGIALIVILLKSASLKPDLFRIGSKDNLTSARIELPLSDKYKDMRKTCR